MTLELKKYTTLDIFSGIYFFVEFSNKNRGSGTVSPVSVKDLYPDFNFPTTPGTLINASMVNINRICTLVGLFHYS